MKNIKINKQSEANRSITDNTSPVKVNIPFINNNPEQKSISCRKGVIPNTKLRNTIDERRSIVPRTFSTMFPMKIRLKIG